ncbi:MAG: acyl-CoA dehydrogenase family protein [Oligoflexales bacterium]|nr:acyl-CoA dehydrogenase family protein [Oligoflexales bacterium]
MKKDNKPKLSSSPFPDFMDLNSLLTEEQQLVQKTVRDFVSQEVEPLIREAYRSEVFPKELIPKLGTLGVLGGQLSGYGLPGMDAISYGLVMKELERCDSGLRSFVSVQGGLVMYPIHAFGSEEQKRTWLGPLSSAEAIGCFGLTESAGGSDPGAMGTKAVKKGSQWVLNGSKMWITNGNLAQIAVVWAHTEDGVRGFLVPTDAKGFRAPKMQGKLSLRASETAELYMDDVKIPLDAMLPHAIGLKAALSCLTQARYGISWGVLGAAEACFDEAAAYVQDRVLFGKALATKQLVQRKLAIMLSRITQGQLLAFRLGQLKMESRLHYAQVSMAKQNNCEMALETARMARDILGANGIMDEYKTMRHMCNLETVNTYEGTSDIHLLIVGAELTGNSAL